MPLQYYKPNKSVKGCACSVSFNSKDAAVYINLIKQVAWDDKNGNGVFKDGAKCVVKMSTAEVSGMIDTIETNRPFSAFHSNDAGSSQINFKAYIAKDNDNKETQKGFGFSVNKTPKDKSEKVSFLIGFNFAEARLLKEYLLFSLGHIFSAWYAADRKKAEDYAQNNKKTDAKTAPKEEPKAAEANPEDELGF